MFSEMYENTGVNQLLKKFINSIAILDEAAKFLWDTE